MRSDSSPRAVSMSTGTAERGPDALQHLEAVHPRQHHVEDHQVPRLGEHLADTDPAVVHGDVTS